MLDYTLGLMKLAIYFIVLIVVSTVYQVLINVNIVMFSNNEKCCQHGSLTVTLTPMPALPMALPHEGTGNSWKRSDAWNFVPEVDRLSCTKLPRGYFSEAAPCFGRC